MEATSEAGWQYHSSPHLNKPRRHLLRPTSNGLFKKLRAGELRGWSERDYRTFCTNRPLRCCCRPLFSLAKWAEEKEWRRRKSGGRRTRWEAHKKHERIFIQVPLILEGVRHTSKRQGSIDSRTGNAPREGWASVSLQSVAARTRAAWQGFKTGRDIWGWIPYSGTLNRSLFLQKLQQCPAYPLP